MAKKRTASKTSSKGKGVVRVDFSDTEERKGSRRYKPGDYAVQVVKVEQTQSGQKKTKQIVFHLKFLDGKYKGKTVYHRCNLLPQSLWVLRNMLEAMGEEVPSKIIKLDLKKYKGKKLAITIDDDEYEGKVRSRVEDTFPLSDLEPRTKGKSKKKPDLEDLDEDEDEDEEEEDDEDEEEEDDEDEDEDDEDEDEDEEEEDDLEDLDLDDV